VKSHFILERTGEEEVVEEIHVRIHSLRLAVAVGVQVVDVAGLAALVTGYCVALALSDEACGEELAEFLDEFAEFLGVVAVCS